MRSCFGAPEVLSWRFLVHLFMPYRGSSYIKFSGPILDCNFLVKEVAGQSVLHHTWSSGMCAWQVGELFHCADAFITLVTVSSDCAKPMQLPFQLQPVTDIEKLRQEVRMLPCALCSSHSFLV